MAVYSSEYIGDICRDIINHPYVQQDAWRTNFCLSIQVQTEQSRTVRLSERQYQKLAEIAQLCKKYDELQQQRERNV